MRILLVNDDGVHSQGLKQLREALEKKTPHEILTVAPLEERSSTGHSVTLDSPLRLSKIEEGVYGCSGYPADCFLMAIGYLVKERRPHLVISGINRGANMAQDIYYSGTVAAAREAALYQTPALAVSLAIDLEAPASGAQHFESAIECVLPLINEDVMAQIDPLTILNVNVPNIPPDEVLGLQVTALGRIIYSEEVEQRTNSRGKDYYWLTGRPRGYDDFEGSDCWACHGHWASLTPLDILYRYDGPSLLAKWRSYFSDAPRPRSLR